MGGGQYSTEPKTKRQRAMQVLSCPVLLYRPSSSCHAVDALMTNTEVLRTSRNNGRSERQQHAVLYFVNRLETWINPVQIPTAWKTIPNALALLILQQWVSYLFLLSSSQWCKARY